MADKTVEDIKKEIYDEDDPMDQVCSLNECINCTCKKDKKEEKV